jgi:hypothetical protein
MGLFTWIKGLGRRGFNAPLSFDEWLATPPPKIAAAINRHLDREIARRRGSNSPAPGNKPAAPSGSPTKPRPTGGRLIYGDRDPGPAEVPCDELMQQWKKECQQLSIDSDYAIPASSFMAQRVVAWARQQQAQALQLPPPGADPVATDEELAYVWIPPRTYEDARRAIYERGRADERTAILRALGVEP